MKNQIPKIINENITIDIDARKLQNNGISQEIWAQGVEEFDADLDGQLSIDEFNKMMQNIQK